MKLYLSPTLEQVKDDNGIGRVVLSQYKHLPGYDIQIVTDPNKADIIAAHINGEWLPRIDVLSSHGLHWLELAHDPYLPLHHEVNARIAQSARRAVAFTVAGVGSRTLQDASVFGRRIDDG